MKKNDTIQVIASLLLLVFSLNTLLGFACSLGFNLGYNKHHHETEVVEFASHTEHHEHANNQQHSEKHKQHHPESGSSDDDCCSNGVTSFNLINKTVPHQVEIVHPVFFSIFTATWFDTGISSYINRTNEIKSFVHRHHPPIPDIRIAIQSFQI